jgi:hypothetical protein
LNTLYTVFDGMKPELSDGSFLSKCQECERGTLTCIFSGTQSHALSCAQGMTKENGKCIYKQIDGCKHEIDENRPQCYSCVIGFDLVSGDCKKSAAL